MRNAYNILVMNYHGRRPFGAPRCRALQISLREPPPALITVLLFAGPRSYSLQISLGEPPPALITVLLLQLHYRRERC
jgi:hypothetical protein